MERYYRKCSCGEVIMSEVINDRNCLNSKSLVFFWPCRNCGGRLVASIEALHEEIQFIERDDEYVIRSPSGRIEFLKHNDTTLTTERDRSRIGIAGCVYIAEIFLSRVKNNVCCGF